MIKGGACFFQPQLVSIWKPLCTPPLQGGDRGPWHRNVEGTKMLRNDVSRLHTSLSPPVSPCAHPRRGCRGDQVAGAASLPVPLWPPPVAALMIPTPHPTLSARRELAITYPALSSLVLTHSLQSLIRRPERWGWFSHLSWNVLSSRAEQLPEPRSGRP